MSIFSGIREELKRHANPERAEQEKRYFRESVKTRGVRLYDARKVARDIFKKHNEELDMKKTLNMAGRLLKTGYFEEGVVGFELLGKFKGQFGRKTFFVFREWLEKYIGNWAHCDELSSHHIYECVKKDPKLLEELYAMTYSPNRWVRRSSAVSLVIAGRRGEFRKDIFRTADKLMEDRDDMVRKGVGWLLKEASKSWPNEVTEFLLRWKGKTSRLVLRYASEKLDKKQRNLVLG